MPDLPQTINLPTITKDWSPELLRNWTLLVQTVNALSRVDTAANKPTTPDLDHIFFTESDTGLTFVAVSGAWRLVSGNAGTTRTITSTDTVTATDYVILADATSGAVTVNLLTAVGRAGRVYVVKKIDVSANAVTVDPAGGETIDGAATKALATQYASTMFVSDNANWFII